MEKDGGSMVFQKGHVWKVVPKDYCKKCKRVLKPEEIVTVDGKPYCAVHNIALKPKPKPRTVPFVIGEDLFKKLIEHMSQKNKFAAMLMFYCGLRVGEVCRLKVRHIDLKKNLLFIEKSKYLVNRNVLIHKEVKPLLLYYMRGKQPDEPLIKTNRHLLFAAVKRAGKLIGYPNLKPHTLRHSYATRLLDKGLTILDIKNLLGHKDISTTQVYLHTSLASIEKKLREVGEL
jgi:integrase/recombinase XerD